MAGAAPVAGSLAALRALGGQSAMLSAPAAAPVASKNMEEAKLRAKYLFREVRPKKDAHVCDKTNERQRKRISLSVCVCMFTWLRMLRGSMTEFG